MNGADANLPGLIGWQTSFKTLIFAPNTKLMI